MDYFDRWLEMDLAQAFKDCGMDYKTYTGFAVPKEVVKRMEKLADEKFEAMMQAGLVPGSRFKS